MQLTFASKMFSFFRPCYVVEVVRPSYFPLRLERGKERNPSRCFSFIQGWRLGRRPTAKPFRMGRSRSCAAAATAAESRLSRLFGSLFPVRSAPREKEREEHGTDRKIGWTVSLRRSKVHSYSACTLSCQSFTASSTRVTVSCGAQN